MPFALWLHFQTWEKPNHSSLRLFLVTGQPKASETLKGGTAFDPKLVWAQGQEKGNPKRSTTTEKEKGNPQRITAGLLYRWRNKVRAVEVTHPCQAQDLPTY